MDRSYQICTRCIMDTSDPDIRFDAEGVCNHCRSYDQRSKAEIFTGEDGRSRLARIVERIKHDGKGKEYDSIMGLSGGVDSSYLAYQVKKLGLRPLAVHFDNGWNSELSVKNIENIVQTLGFDLYTYVINWEEFRDLQRSFFKASVVDIELLTDNAIFATLINIARERGIRYSLEGHNIATEVIMPASWNHWKYDLRNIKAIQHRFGTRKIETLPMIGPWRRLFYRATNILEPVFILNYLHYNKSEAMRTLEQEVGWKYYGGKHYESVFTKFYQAYVLPVKFGIDKRRAHYSNLICSGQLDRQDALKMMEEELYPAEDLRRDRAYVLKKLGFSEQEFDQIMRSPVVPHRAYASGLRRYQGFMKAAKLLLPLRRRSS